MSTHKNIDKICVVAVVLSLLVCVLFMNAQALGVQAISNEMGYENRLFDNSKVHTIDIIMDDWDSFIQTCENEEYAVCTVVIDGESYKNVGIRAKGNTSLSSVKSMDSDRYSFKIEFDQYDSTNTYYGLDKLSLNNIIQDNTFMKDYLVYQSMVEFGVDAPLCSYSYITVNGEDWGLYLAVEAIEDSFLQRNYGNDYGELYKPDSMSFGGGRGNGKDFNVSEFINEGGEFELPEDFEIPERMELPENFEMPERMEIPENFEMPEGTQVPEMPGNEQQPIEPGTDSAGSENNTNNADSGRGSRGNKGFGGGAKEFGGGNAFGGGEMNDFGGGNVFGGGEKNDFGGGKGGGMGMGSSDVKLQYIDDDPDSYSNIFNNAKTDITSADKTRLIKSLKALSEGEDIENIVDVEEVIRYFVVHNFVCNGDSYTGAMIHNYYLYEEDGQFSMIPWDYNLAFGGFQSSNATDTVNEPIDSPVSGGDTNDRPMIAWILENEEYTDMYHQYFAEFLNTVNMTEIIDHAAELIAPYVEKDPGKFCTYEEFETGVDALRKFCELRSESVSGQLAGEIPATSEGQAADSSALIDASDLTISDMGSMGHGGMGGGFPGSDRGDKGSFEGFGEGRGEGENFGNFGGDQSEMPMPDFGGEDMMPPEGMEMPEGMPMPPEGMEMPEGMSIPEDFEIPGM